MTKLPKRLAHLAAKTGIAPRNVESPQWVYVIRCEGFAKIGIAADPDKRLIELQVGNPFDLVLALKLRSDNARRDERILHKLLRPHHHRGEWFKVTEAFDALLNAQTIGVVR